MDPLGSPLSPLLVLPLLVIMAPMGLAVRWLREVARLGLLGPIHSSSNKIEGLVFVGIWKRGGVGAVGALHNHRLVAEQHVELGPEEKGEQNGADQIELQDGYVVLNRERKLVERTRTFTMLYFL
jgi:hypothetical protein